MVIEEAADILDHLREPVNARDRAGREGPYPYFGATGQVGWIDGFRFDGEFVLLGEDGAPFLEAAKSKAYMAKGRFWVNNHAHVLKGKSGICDDRFLMHALNHTDYHAFVKGTTRLKLNQASMRRIPIAVPPLTTQQRIAAKLDELFSDLDAGVAALHRAKAKLARYRAAVLKAAVEGRLTEQWRREHPDVEPAEELLKRLPADRRKAWQTAAQPARGRPYREPMVSDGRGRSTLPRGWCAATFDQCAWEITVGHVGPMKERYVETGVPFLRSQNVRPLAFDRSGLKFIPPDFHHNLLKSRLIGGELLVVRSGNIGEACVYPQTEPESNCADLVIGRMISSVATPEYTALFVNSPAGQRAVVDRRTGSALTHFNVGAMRRSLLPLPPLAEQLEIVAICDNLLTLAAATEVEVLRSAQRVQQLRSGVLAAAFAGHFAQNDGAAHG